MKVAGLHVNAESFVCNCVLGAPYGLLLDWLSAMMNLNEKWLALANYLNLIAEALAKKKNQTLLEILIKLSRDPGRDPG